MRIERGFDLPEARLDRVAVHGAVPLAAGVPVPVFAAEGAVELQHQPRHLLGDLPHAGHVFAVFQVQHRANVQAADAGVAVEGAVGPVALDQLAEAVGELGQPGRGDGTIFDERDGLAVPRQAVEQGHGRAAQVPKLVAQVGPHRRDAGRHAGGAVEPPPQLLDAVGDFQFRIADELHHQQGVRRPLNGGHHRLEAALRPGEADQHGVHQLHGRRLKLQAHGDGIQRRAQGGEVRHQQPARRRLGDEVKLRLRQHRQRPLRPDDQRHQRPLRRPADIPSVVELRQIGREVVPAHAPQNVREAGDDLGPVRRQHVVQRPQAGALGRLRGLADVVFRGRQFPQRDRLAVAQDRVQTFDVVNRLPVLHRARAGRVVADHAAERRPARRRHVRPEQEVVRGEALVQVVQNHARLHARRAAGHIHLQHLIQILGTVDDQPRPNGLPGETGPAAARHDGRPRLQRDLNRGGQGFDRARDDHAGRHHLIDARVRGVQPPARVVEADLAVNVLGQVADEALALLGGEVVHGGNCTAARLTSPSRRSS